MKTLYSLAGLLLLAAPAMAQGERMRMSPPPDHWMTFDSLAAAVGVTDAQKPDVQKHYDALNAVMKRAADKRAEMRSQMAGGPPPQEQMAAMRTEFDKLQGEVDAHYGELRKLLNAEQQAKLDALPKPMVRMMRRPPPGM